MSVRTTRSSRTGSLLIITTPQLTTPSIAQWMKQPIAHRIVQSMNLSIQQMEQIYKRAQIFMSLKVLSTTPTSMLTFTTIPKCRSFWTKSWQLLQKGPLSWQVSHLTYRLGSIYSASSTTSASAVSISSSTSKFQCTSITILSFYTKTWTLTYWISSTSKSRSNRSLIKKSIA